MYFFSPSAAASSASSISLYQSLYLPLFLPMLEFPKTGKAVSSFSRSFLFLICFNCGFYILMTPLCHFANLSSMFSSNHFCLFSTRSSKAFFAFSLSSNQKRCIARNSLGYSLQDLLQETALA
jgi:hypothetical protein